MKAKALVALTLALLMTVTMCAVFPAAADDPAPTLPIVYDPVASLNAAAGNIGIGQEGFVAWATGTATFDGVFALNGAEGGDWKMAEAGVDAVTAPLNSVEVTDTQWNNTLAFKPAPYEYSGTTYKPDRGTVKILQYDNSDASTRTLWWTPGESWFYPVIELTFTAPESGVYDITAPEAFANVKRTAGAINDGAAVADAEITFAIIKGEETLGSVTVKGDESKAFPTVADLELTAGETVTFRVSTDPAKSDSCWYGLVIEAHPIVTLKELASTGDEPVVYNPTASLNAAAGNIGIGQEGFVNWATGTATFDGVFALNGAEGGDWKMAEAGVDAVTAPLNSVEVTDTQWNNTLVFKPAPYEYSGTTYKPDRGTVTLFQYDNSDASSRTLWWTPGESWYYPVVEMTFTAPESGVYDITGLEGYADVHRTPAAVRDGASVADAEITFAIIKGEETLGSVTVKGDEAKDFPAVTDLELTAGETVTFRVSTDPAKSDSCWYGLVIEANPVVTLKEVSAENVAPVLKVTDKIITTKGNDAEVKLTATDANGDALTVTQTVEAAHGDVTVDLENGKLIYTPDTDFVGEDTFTLLLSDGELTDEAVVTVNVYADGYEARQGIKDTFNLFYDGPQGDDYLDFLQDDAVWQWQVAYDGLLGTNAQGWRLAEMAQWNQWGYCVVHQDAPAMNIVPNSDGSETLMLNCDKPFGLNAKGALTFVAPEDGTYVLTHADMMSTLGLDTWRITDANSIHPGDRYTTPVYVSITKDNKIVWPENGEPMKFDPADTNLENLKIAFPEITTAMKKGESLRIVVEMDDECTSWMNRIFCDPIVYLAGEYDAEKDLNAATTTTTEATTTTTEADTVTTTTTVADGGNEGDGDEDENPTTGHAFPVAIAVAGAMALATVLITKKRK